VRVLVTEVRVLVTEVRVLVTEVRVLVTEVRVLVTDERVLLTEVRVLHGLSCGQPLLVVVAQQLVQQVQGFGADQVLVLCLDKLLPALPCLPGSAKVCVTWLTPMK